jgi:hypothetical protein
MSLDIRRTEAENSHQTAIDLPHRKRSSLQEPTAIKTATKQNGHSLRSGHFLS